MWSETEDAGRAHLHSKLDVQPVLFGDGGEVGGLASDVEVAPGGREGGKGGRRGWEVNIEVLGLGSVFSSTVLSNIITNPHTNQPLALYLDFRAPPSHHPHQLPSPPALSP